MLFKQKFKCLVFLKNPLPDPLIYVCHAAIPLRFYCIVNVVNYSNSFVNRVVYVLRIESKQTLNLCCLGRVANMSNMDDAAAAMVLVTRLRTSRGADSNLQLAF